MNQINTDNLDIKEGSLNFWIPKNPLMFNLDLSVPLININPNGGSILIIKDSDKKLKVMFVVLGKGRIDLEYDISDININTKHMITLTWSLNTKELILYFDGQLAVKKQINI